MMEHTKDDMEKEGLYSIMRDLLQVEYDQESLLCLLRAAEASYMDEKHMEAKLITNGNRFYLKGLQKELKEVINRLDLYITEKVKEK